MAVKFSNNATTNLTANAVAGATSFSVADASTFPILGPKDWCFITLVGENTEVVRVTAINGTTFSCAGLANDYNSGDVAALRVSAETMDDVYEGAGHSYRSAVIEYDTVLDEDTEYFNGRNLTVASGVTLTLPLSSELCMKTWVAKKHL